MFFVICKEFRSKTKILLVNVCCLAQAINNFHGGQFLVPFVFLQSNVRSENKSYINLDKRFCIFYITKKFKIGIGSVSFLYPTFFLPLVQCIFTFCQLQHLFLFIFHFLFFNCGRGKNYLLARKQRKLSQQLMP